MRKLILFIISLAFYNQVFSQTVVVTDNAAYTTGNASSVLDVNSVLKGFLAPRMTQAQRTAISSPADGLLVYQTDATKGFYYYNGTSAAWTFLSTSAGTFWSLTGNAGTNSSANYLGTTDAVSLRMRTNATQRVILDSVGSVGIGSSPVFTAGAPRERFLVDAGSTSTNPTTSYNVISGKGYIDNYLQLNIQNNAPTASASSDVVASNDAATQTVNFVDMGINSSGNTSTGVLGGASTAYLYGTGNDFAIGNGTANKNLLFFTGGVASNERMRIDGSGNIGIGTNSPLYKLHVSATSNPLYLTGVQTGASTDSLLTIIGGVVKKITPSVLTASGSWSLTGNSNTLTNNYFLGTTNTDPLLFKVNSQLSGRIDLVNTFLGYQSGYNSNAANQNSGFGYHSLFAVTSGTNNSALGYNSLPNLVSGSYNVGIGYSTDGANSVSNTIGIGASTYITGSFSTAIGTSAQVQTTNGLAIGHSTYVDHSYAIAIGEKAQAQGTSAIVIGDNAYSSSTNAVAIGGTTASTGTQAMNTNAVAIGNVAYAGGASSVAIGDNTSANATNSMALGYNAKISQSNGIVLGDAANNNVNVGIGTNTPSAKLHIYATTGNNPLLIQGLPAGAASDNLLSINTTTGVVNSSPITTLIGSTWNLAGNSGTNSSTNYLGTTDAVSLRMRTNATQRVILDSVGSVGIGSSPIFTAGTPRERFLVDAGSTSTNPTTSYNVISGKGYIDNYLQLNIQNNAPTASASSDVVASNDAATQVINYVDMGINSSGNTSTGVLGGASTAYLYGTGNDFAIGNGTANKNLLFFTGGVASNERMRIDGSGNVGVATTTPAAKLDVSGTYKLGTAGTVLTNMIKTNFTVSDNSTFAYNSPTQVESVTVTGATSHANLIINPRTALPAGISVAWARVTATNSVDVGFVNADATARAIGTIVFDVTVIQ